MQSSEPSHLLSREIDRYVQFATSEGVLLTGSLCEADEGWATAVLVPAFLPTQEHFALNLIVAELKAAGLSTLLVNKHQTGDGPAGDEVVTTSEVAAAISFVQGKCGDVPIVLMGEGASSCMLLAAVRELPGSLGGVVLVSPDPHLTMELANDFPGHLIVLCDRTDESMNEVGRTVNAIVWKVEGMGRELCEVVVRPVCSALIGMATSTY